MRIPLMLPSHKILSVAAPILCTALLISQAKTQDAAAAIALEQQGQFAQAAEVWRGVTKANPRDAGAFASLGLDLARQEKYAEAVSAYKKAVALNPKLPGLQLNLGLAEFKQGHFNAAAAPLRAASASDPRNAQARTLLGMSYYGAKRFAEAIKV